MNTQDYNVSNARFRRLFLGASFILCYVVVLTLSQNNGISFHPDGPGRRTSEVTRALWNQHTLSPPEFEDIRKRAVASSLKTQSIHWQDAFSLGNDGTLYPKHSLFSGFIAVPGYALFGDSGFFVTQGIVLLILVLSLQAIVCRHLQRDPSIILLLSIFLGTEMFYRLNSYSYDVQGTMLILLSIALAKRYPCLSGVTSTLSYFVRPANLLFLPFIPLACLSSTQKRGAIHFSIGVIMIACVIFISNYLMFGNPLTSTYQRLPVVNGEELIVRPHTIGFDSTVFLSDWYQKLFSPTYGLIRFNMSIALFPIALYGIVISKQKRELVLLGIGALAYGLFFFGYPHWNSTSNGNRFLLPATFIYLIPFLIGIEKLLGTYFVNKNKEDTL